ncbi:nucleotide exchange factor GrpE [Dactylosporangium sp. CA-052675]|uniref:nucleotide exchange factor GrpE n=1 Tax=Dactylosporangium sp. CA-052675 TaxID=3239927 RepID=UPI003D8A1E0C
MDDVDWQERWRRAAADADNARKRCDRLLAERTAAERVRCAAAWLPLLDGLDLALEHAGADPATIVAGVERVREEGRVVLGRLGFEPLGAPGEVFDPARHEATEAVAGGPDGAGMVVRVIRPGYGGPDGLLRPAAVAVAVSGDDSPDGSGTDEGEDPGEERPDDGA